MLEYKKKLMLKDKLESDFQQLFFNRQEQKSILYIQGSIFKKMETCIKI
jgi:TorA maturation chaperone TorD